ncbi:MAG: helix-turn-helix transcriptional regulator [Ktedonobacteraceae bacterium]|nr:helix-turn-helix transcriptional regulator [Ktedonobacteraceae bacterium]
MAERTKLINARKRRHWSQTQAADLAGVSSRAWITWEQGHAAPHLSSIDLLCKLFECSAEDLDFGGVENSLAIADSAMHPVAFVDLTMQLLTVAFVPQRRFESVQTHITTILEDYDAMTGEIMNRREALARLASLPLIASLRPGVSNPRAEDVITQCAASIAACWELSKSSYEEDLHRAFQTASTFVPALKAFMESSQYHKDAATLIGQCSLLKTVLGWHLQGVKEAAVYARESIAYAQEAGDIILQVSAMDYLCWALYYDNKTQQAEQNAAKAKRLVEKHRQELPPILCSGVYSTYAVMQAKNGGNATATFDQAGQYFANGEQAKPLKYIYMDYTKSALVLNDGMIHYFADEQSQAMTAFEKIINPSDLSARLVLPGRTQVETLNFMAMSTLRRKDKDMEESLHYWKAAMQGAMTLQSEQRFNEAKLTYDIMDVVWSGDKRIKAMRELTTHW